MTIKYNSVRIKNTAILLMLLASCLGFAQSSCTTTAEGNPVFSNNFGTGSATTTDQYVVGHTYQGVDPQDGFYSVTRSLSQSVGYTQTDLTGNKDAGYNSIADGSIDGRYLAININSGGSLNAVIYRVGG